MLYLHFKGYGSGQEASLGPATSFRIAGNFIRDAETGQILARYLNHFWHVGDKCFTRYDCEVPVRIHFEDAEGGKTDAYGPFASLWIADGSVYCNDQLVAKFMDTSLLWHDHVTDTFWPNMILSSGK